MTPPESPNGSAPVPPAPPPPAPATPPPPPQAAAGASKADPGKRFIAVIIDCIPAIIVGFIPIVGGLVAAAYMLVRDGLDIEFMDRRSLGKKIVKLRPVRRDGQPMDVVTSIKRNIPFAIGPAIMIVPILGWIIGPVVALIVVLVEGALVFTDPAGRRLGDQIAETTVVEVGD